MDTGSACSRFNIYGQRIIWVVYYGHLLWTIRKLLIATVFYYMDYGCLLLGDEAIYYAKWIISTGRYHDNVDINHWNSYLLYTSHVDNTISSSDVAIFDVCIYSASRFAPINIPNYAGSVGKTISFL